MGKEWLEIRLAIRSESVDLASQLLAELGSTGITAAEKELDTFTLPDPDSLQNDPVIKAYFPGTSDPARLCDLIVATFACYPGLFPGFNSEMLTCTELAASDWANDWRQHFATFRVGSRLVIRPSWATPENAPGDVVLTLDPGQAFGTGTHETTALCLAVVADCFAEPPFPASVLDVGTGSGILAMAAAALGATDVIGCDIDPEACRVAATNIAENGLADRIRVTGSPLEEIDGTFDLVLANILAHENLRLARPLADHLAPGGRLVLSGILVEQEEMMTQGLSDLPLKLERALHREEWACMVYRRHG